MANAMMCPIQRFIDYYQDRMEKFERFGSLYFGLGEGFLTSLSHEGVCLIQSLYKKMRKVENSDYSRGIGAGASANGSAVGCLQPNFPANCFSRHNSSF
jgi:hypothetical protein